MPTLDWIGKQAVVRHHAEVPFHLLKEEPGLSCGGEAGAGNLIVQGDNLKALKALLPHYGGQVKCIYIDPPYNTGNEGWVYNDNVNSPEIRRWLADVVGPEAAKVGKEGEDLTRHDKWLCMMYPRLMLLKRFLREDGAIFVSLDYHEQPRLRLLMDEIFGSANFVAEIACVNKPSGRSDDKYIATAHETITIYRKSASLKLAGFAPDQKIVSRYSKVDDNGDRFREEDLRKRGDQDERKDRPNLFYPFFFREDPFDLIIGEDEDLTPEGYIRIEPMKSKSVQGRWRWERNTAIEYKSYLHPRYMPNKGQWSIFEWEYLKERGAVKPTTLWDFKDVNSERGTETFSKVLGFPKAAFPNPKPVGTIKRVIQIASDPGDLVMDSFAGSGTTGQAVLEVNFGGDAISLQTDESSEAGSGPSAAKYVPHRRFILVEMDENIAQNVTAERVRRVSEGYKNAKGEVVPGLGSGFRFAKLGKTLFDETGAIREDVKFRELAEFVYFHHTGSPMPKGWKTSPLLGTVDGRAIYLLYNGILGDRSIDGGNVLTAPVLAELPPHDGPKTIYAAACRLGPNRLERERIQFKQTPYGLRVD